MIRTLSSVRVRATAASTIVALAALCIAGVVLVAVVQRAPLQSVDETLDLRATDIESLLDTGATPATVAIESEEASFIQIVDATGSIIASSSNISGEPSFATALDPVSFTTDATPIGNGDVRVRLRHSDSNFHPLIIVGTSLDELNGVRRVLIVALSIVVPLLAALIAVLTWLVVGRALRPVEEIRRSVDHIDAERISQHVPVPQTDDEIARLATTMNRMLDRLAESQRRQQRFVSDASHELRTPIAVIRHEIEVARSSATVDWSETAEDVLAENLRMQRIVDDLLFMARQQHHLIDVSTLVDLDDIVFTEASRRSQNPLDVSGVSAGQVRGDAGQLARMVSNLIDNATRHCTSQVALSVRTFEETVTLTVEDDGPGIPNEMRDEIFEPFTRLDDGRSRDAGGSGLGLAIVRDIATAHGGRISIDQSDALGGARFTITIPDART